MYYDLQINGQSVGTFPLDRLRERRRAGELSGNELVRRSGTLEWTPLDSELIQAEVASKSHQAARMPPPVPEMPAKAKPRKRMVVLLVAAGLFVAASVAFVSWTSMKIVKEFRTTIRKVQAAGDNGVAAASRPIVFDKDTKDENFSREKSKQFRIKHYVQAYQELGRHDVSWDGDVRAMMDAWIDVQFGNGTNYDAAAALSDKVAQSGCDDPVALTVSAINAIEGHEEIRRLERAVAAFEKSKYKSYPRFYATVYLGNSLGSGSSRRQELDQRAVQYYTTALTDASLGKGDDEEIAENLINGWGSGFFKRNRKAVIKATEGLGHFKWLALVLRGEGEIQDAWAARGSDTANRVTSEGWRRFYEHLKKAETALTEAWEMEPGRVLAPASMISVAMGQPGGGAEEMRLWFDRATKARIDYPHAWTKMRWGLRPRWHGSHEAMIALGVQAIKTKRFDTDVPRKFYDIVQDIEAESELSRGEHLFDQYWPHFVELYEGYIADPSTKAQEKGWRTSYATVAYFAEEYETARKQFEAMDWKPQTSNLTGWGVELSLMPLKVAALTGNSSSLARKAELSYEQGNPAEAIKLFTELEKSGDALSKDFSRSRLAALKQEDLLAKGEWVALLPSDENDPNWQITDAKLRRTPEGALEVEAGKKGHSLYSRTRVGTEFEVTGEFEVVQTSTKDFQAGLIMGLPDSDSSWWYGFRMKRNSDEGDVASFSQGWTRKQVARPAALKQGMNTFQFRLREKKADAWVNGTQVLQGAVLKSLYLYPDSVLGLGAYNDMNETVIRYSNVKVRRLVPGRQ